MPTAPQSPRDDADEIILALVQEIEALKAN
jgi:hypothetical protein